MNKSHQSRREFIKTGANVGAGLSLALSSAASYSRVLGANDRINLAFVGLRSRGMALLESAIDASGNFVRVHSI